VPHRRATISYSPLHSSADVQPFALEGLNDTVNGLYKSYSYDIVQTMGWLRLVGSLKLQVSFAEYSLFYGALLQKRPIILRSLLMVATPYRTPVQTYSPLHVRIVAMGCTVSCARAEQVQSSNALGYTVSYKCRALHSRTIPHSLAEYCLFCRALLQKRLVILSILLTKATP